MAILATMSIVGVKNYIEIIFILLGTISFIWSMITGLRIYSVKNNNLDMSIKRNQLEYGAIPHHNAYDDLFRLKLQKSVFILNISCLIGAASFMLLIAVIGIDLLFQEM